MEISRFQNTSRVRVRGGKSWNRIDGWDRRGGSSNRSVFVTRRIGFAYSAENDGLPSSGLRRREGVARRCRREISSNGKRRIYVPRAGSRVETRRVHFNALVERPGGAPRLLEREILSKPRARPFATLRSKTRAGYYLNSNVESRRVSRGGKKRSVERMRRPRESNEKLTAPLARSRASGNARASTRE